ncbi:MAG: response regulator [Burkholderiales bacterium]|nr:response regulator [Burkholderiales bacterium]
MASILIVEDNPQNMKLETFLLESDGHTVFQANDAVSGLQLAASRRPDLVLMDIQLPGMDGLEAARRLKADPLTAGIVIYALTAFAMKGDEERIREAGCDGYISKPIRHREFLDTVKHALGEGK